MNKTFAAAALAAATLAASGLMALPDVELYVGTAAITGAGAEITNSDIEMFTADASGNLYFTNATDTNDTDGFAVVRVAAGPTLTILADGADILAAIDAANGGDPAPAFTTVRGMGVDSNGDVILATDPNGSADAYLLRVSGTTPGTVEVIAGEGVPNIVDGATSMNVVGTTAYVAREGNFADAANSNFDSIATFSTSGAANAAQAGSILINDTTLTGASGFNVAAADLAMNGVAPYTGTDFLIMDSGAAGSSDSIAASTSAGALTILKAGTALESELGYTDVGFACITANPANGDIYLWMNDFNTPTTDGNAFIKIPGGTGTASILITEAQIQADPDYNTTGFFSNAQGIAYQGGYLYWTDDNTEAIYRISVEGPTAADNWNMYY